MALGEGAIFGNVELHLIGRQFAAEIVAGFAQAPALVETIHVEPVIGQMGRISLARIVVIGPCIQTGTAERWLALVHNAGGKLLGGVLPDVVLDVAGLLVGPELHSHVSVVGEPMETELLVGE